MDLGSFQPGFVVEPAGGGSLGVHIRKEKAAHFKTTVALSMAKSHPKSVPRTLKLGQGLRRRLSWPSAPVYHQNITVLYTFSTFMAPKFNFSRSRVRSYVVRGHRKPRDQAEIQILRCD